MNPLPSKSQASITKGLWFVFQIGNHTVRAWVSCLSGAERVYVDNAVVSELRNLRMTGTHSFTVAEAEYVVTFRILSIFRLECSMLRNGKVLKRYIATYSVPSLIYLIVIAPIIGFLASWLRLPPWAGLGFLALAVSVIIRTQEKGGFSVKENNVS